MKTQSYFRDYNPDQLMLFPTDLKQWLPEDDLVYFLIDVVDELDLQPIYREYNHHRAGSNSFATIHNALKQCAVFANDHSFRALQGFE